MARVLVTGSSVSDEILTMLSDANHTYEKIAEAEKLEPNELLRAFNDVDAYLCGGDERTGEEIYAFSPNLKVISFLGVGYGAFMDEHAASAHGIAITNTPGTLTNSVAEATIGMLLCLSRHLVASGRALEMGKRFVTKSNDIKDKTIGILGMGDIGKCMAQKLVEGFGVQIIYHNRNRIDEACISFPALYVEKEELFASSDAVIIMATGQPINYGIVGWNELKKLRKGAFLVNTARPELIEPVSLQKWLEQGDFGGLGIDGYYDEDNFEVEDDKYGILGRSHDNILVTPHIGSLTHDARDQMGRLAVKNIIDFLDKGTSPHIVNEAYRTKS